jgi:error-prone DNA polymerase
MIATHEKIEVDLAHLPADDPKVYAMMNEADTVGVFQVESRAQMASLPKNAPTKFYDLVVQVAIIRPGPIVGGMVHPFFDRRQGKAPVEYPHPCLEPILKRTLGVPLFQEQLLRIAMVAAGFTGGEAEELRRAMGFKRSMDKMTAIEARLRSGMTERGIDGPAQDQIVKSITSFALYGFPESHAASFALIAYASAYLKARHPAAFYASILNCWPMGFYHPATLVKDAQRHGTAMFSIDVARSGWKCRWEAGGVRLGLRFVQGLREATGKRIEEEGEARPFSGVEEFARRCALRGDELERLAHAGALASFGRSRRAALWQVAKVARRPGDLFADLPVDDPSPLPEMTPEEETAADYRSAQMTTGPHLVEHWRRHLSARGIYSAAELKLLPNGRRVQTAGAVIVRQRPGTAKGFVFLTLEDETGMMNVVVTPKRFEKQALMISRAPLILVRGTLQVEQSVVNLRGEAFHELKPGVSLAGWHGHDFH